MERLPEIGELALQQGLELDGLRVGWREAPGQGELWISAVDHDGRPLAHDRRPVEGTSWQDTEIALPIAQGAAQVYFGARLTGGGRLFLDHVQVTATGGPDAAPREILADGFERDAVGGYPMGGSSLPMLVPPATAWRLRNSGPARDTARA